MKKLYCVFLCATSMIWSNDQVPARLTVLERAARVVSQAAPYVAPFLLPGMAGASVENEEQRSFWIFSPKNQGPATPAIPPTPLSTEATIGLSVGIPGGVALLVAGCMCWCYWYKIRDCFKKCSCGECNCPQATCCLRGKKPEPQDIEMASGRKQKVSEQKSEGSGDSSSSSVVVSSYTSSSSSYSRSSASESED